LFILTFMLLSLTILFREDILPSYWRVHDER